MHGLNPRERVRSVKILGGVEVGTPDDYYGYDWIVSSTSVMKPKRGLSRDVCVVCGRDLREGR